MDEVHQKEATERRPISSREMRWVQAMAKWLAEREVSPNGISAWSAMFSLAGAAAITATEFVPPGPARGLWFAGAVWVQLRLMANLLDGMVALRSNKASPLGELFNEVPDRISDIALFLALGFVAGSHPHLGYIAALLAVFVAYLRAMGAVAGAGQAFHGVMAKPQRMFLVTLLCLFEAFAPASWQGPWLNQGLGASGCVLILVSLGCLLTAWTRLSTITMRLRTTR